MWEYVKGSEADFEGAPEWARYVDQTQLGGQDYWFTENYDIGGRFVKKGDYMGVSKYKGCEVLSIVIAERRKVDNLQSRVNDDVFARDLAAVATLEAKGYTWRGGELWVPPIGPVPGFIQTEALISERGTRYGEFKDGAAIMQQLKDVMKGAPKWEALKPSQKEALEMIQHKIGRILNGDPDYDDNWKDIAGYATLIVKELQ